MKQGVSEIVLREPGLKSIHAFNYKPQMKTVTFDAVVDFSVHDIIKCEQRILQALLSSYPDIDFTVNIDFDYS